MGANLTPEQITNLKGNKINIHLPDQILIMLILRSNIPGNSQQNMNNLIEITHEGTGGGILEFGTELSHQVLMAGDVQTVLVPFHGHGQLALD